MNVTEGFVGLNVATDFSLTPGPRFRSEGKWSGEEFRETLLQKRFEQALQAGVKLEVDLDGVYGYPPSFLEEAFGGLARIYDPDLVEQTLRIKSEDEPLICDDVFTCIRRARG